MADAVTQPDEQTENTEETADVDQLSVADELQQQINELTGDLQRTRADFENYRKRVESERQQARRTGEQAMILKLLPVIDTLERAIGHVPADLKDDKWAAGIVNVTKNMNKTLESIGLTRIDASEGVVFNPELHQAVQVDEDADGDVEVISEELQAGYLLDGAPIRHSMVKVSRQ